MKTLTYIMMVVFLLLVVTNANAQYEIPKMAYGIDIGLARGDNAGADDNIVFMMRGSMQMKLASSIATQISLGYTQLTADDPSYYSTKPILIDGRLLFAPITMNEMFPFLYVGLGVGKNMSANGGDFLPYIPIGIGVESKIGPQLMFRANIGYNLVLSDALDGKVRTNSQLNRFTNGKQDGFAELMLGLAYTAAPVQVEQDEPYIYIGN